MQNSPFNPDQINLPKGVNSPTDTGPKPKNSSLGVREFNRFVSDIEEMLKGSANLSGEDLEKAKVKLQERITAAKESITEIGVALAPRAREAATVTNNYVHEKPWSAIGISAAAGFLSGYLFSRR